MRFKVIDHFLSDEECDALIAAATAKGLARSKGYNIAEKQHMVVEARTSENSYFLTGENELVSKIEQRLFEETNIPVENGEGIQILRYQIGQFYRPHSDYFDPVFEANKPLLDKGQRIMTVLMYLSNVEEGGETAFPNAKFEVVPRKGRALFWYNVKEDGKTIDMTTIHEAKPVIKGTKFVATKWLRSKKYE